MLEISNLIDEVPLDEYQFSFCDGGVSAFNNFSSVTLLGDSCMFIEATNFGEMAIDTYCIMVCNEFWNICDTIILFVTFDNKYKSDTVLLGRRDSICIPTDNGMNADIITLQFCGSIPNNISDIEFNKNNGCNNLSYNATSLGRDSICAVICDTILGICDTTIVIIDVVIPKKDTVRLDYQGYAWGLVDRQYCVEIENFFDINESNLSLNNSTSTFSGNVFNAYTTNSLCVHFNTKPLMSGTDTLVVVVCDNSLSICDTTILILTYSLLFNIDTLTIYATSQEKNFCLPLEAPLTEENAVSAFCDGAISSIGVISVVQFIGNNCIGYNLWNTPLNDIIDTFCIITSNQLTGAYDITILNIKMDDNNAGDLHLSAFVDINKNCVDDSLSELNMPILIKVNNIGNNENFYHSFISSTDIKLDTGVYEIIPVNYDSNISLCNPIIITVDTTLIIPNDTIHHNILFIPNVNEERLQIEIYSNRIRYCNSPISYFVNYSNHSLKPVFNAFIDVSLDDQLRFSQSYFSNYNLIDSTHIRFYLGTLSPYQSGQFTFTANLPCGVSTPGETHCTEAHIFPDTLAQRLYFGPEIAVEGNCLGDSVEFRVTNNGNPMTQPAIYLVFEDDLMIKRSSYQLANDASFTEKFIANGHTYRMEAHLYSNPPQVYGDSISSAWVEGCDNTGGTVSKGYVLMYDLDEEVDYIARDCHPSVTSWDPNEKTTTPIGYHEQHYIRKNQEMEYGINFENLGNDTAYLVNIIDTLSQELDTNSFSMLLSSHPCFYTLENYILTVIFPNINLLWTNGYPDSSKGFFLYRIQPKDDIALSSKIENTAYIYFDNNSPVQTNTTFHTIGEKFVRVLSVYNQQGKQLEARVYPNPASARVHIEMDGLLTDVQSSITLYSIDGKEINASVMSEAGRFSINTSNLSEGMYIFTLQNGEQMVSGKFIIER